MEKTNDLVNNSTNGVLDFDIFKTNWIFAIIAVSCSPEAARRDLIAFLTNKAPKAEISWELKY